MIKLTYDQKVLLEALGLALGALVAYIVVGYIAYLIFEVLVR